LFILLIFSSSTPSSKMLKYSSKSSKSWPYEICFLVIKISSSTITNSSSSSSKISKSSKSLSLKIQNSLKLINITVKNDKFKPVFDFKIRAQYEFEKI